MKAEEDQMPIYNPGIFSATCPELAIVDWFIGAGLTIFTAMLPVVIAIMITQRS